MPTLLRRVRSLDLMKIPTTLSLADHEIDRLIRAASDLVVRDADFQRLMRDIQGKATH